MLELTKGKLGQVFLFYVPTNLVGIFIDYQGFPSSYLRFS